MDAVEAGAAHLLREHGDVEDHDNGDLSDAEFRVAEEYAEGDVGLVLDAMFALAGVDGAGVVVIERDASWRYGLRPPVTALPVVQEPELEETK